MDWPGVYYGKNAITPFSPECPIGDGFRQMWGNIDIGDGSWPTANLGIWVPFKLERPAVVRQFFVVNAGVVSGSFDAGVYGWDLIKRVSQSATQTGTNTRQMVDCTDTALGPGWYYMALAHSDTTGQYRRSSSAAWKCLRATGIFQQASAFTLPSTVTPAAVGSSWIPHFGIQIARLP